MSSRSIGKSRRMKNKRRILSALEIQQQQTVVMSVHQLDPADPSLPLPRGATSERNVPINPLEKLKLNRTRAFGGLVPDQVE